MTKDPTIKERLGSLETLISARHAFDEERRDAEVKWREKIEKKIDRVIQNSKASVTTKLLGEAIAAHAESCPGRNPEVKDDGDWISKITKSWRTLGIVGACFAVILGLIGLIFQLVELLGGMQ